MMDCRTARDLLSEYVDRRLAEKDSASLEEHLRVCRDCASELAGLRSVIERVQALGPAPLPEGFISKVSAAARQQTKQQPARWQGLRWLVPGLAVLMVSFLAWRHFPWDQSAGELGGVSQMAARVAEKGVAADTQPPAALEERRDAKQPANRLPAPVAPGAGAGRQATSEPARTAGSAARLTAPTEGERLAGDRQAAGRIAESLELRAEGPSADTEARQPAAPATGGAYAPPRVTVEEQPAGNTMARNMQNTAATRDRVALGAQSALRRTQSPFQNRPGTTSGVAGTLKAQPSGAPREGVQRLSARAAVRTDAAGAPVVTLRVTAAPSADRLRVRLAAKGDDTPLWESLGGTGQWRQTRAIRGSGEPQVVRVSLAEPLAYDETDRADALVGKETASRPATRPKSLATTPGDYLLFIPSRARSGLRVSADYRSTPIEEAFADLSERAGVVILAPVLADVRVTTSLSRVAAAEAVRLVADSAGLRLYSEGLAFTLEAE